MWESVYIGSYLVIPNFLDNLVILFINKHKINNKLAH